VQRDIIISQLNYNLMTIEEFKQEHPELYKKIWDEAYDIGRRDGANYGEPDPENYENYDYYDELEEQEMRASEEWLDSLDDEGRPIVHVKLLNITPHMINNNLKARLESLKLSPVKKRNEDCRYCANDFTITTICTDCYDLVYS
jgi:hypothetical protein